MGQSEGKSRFGGAEGAGEFPGDRTGLPEGPRRAPAPPWGRGAGEVGARLSRARRRGLLPTGAEEACSLGSEFSYKVRTW